MTYYEPIENVHKNQILYNQKYLLIISLKKYQKKLQNFSDYQLNNAKNNENSAELAPRFHSYVGVILNNLKSHIRAFVHLKN